MSCSISHLLIVCLLAESCNRITISFILTGPMCFFVCHTPNTSSGDFFNACTSSVSASGTHTLSCGWKYSSTWCLTHFRRLRLRWGWGSFACNYSAVEQEQATQFLISTPCWRLSDNRSKLSLTPNVIYVAMMPKQFKRWHFSCEHLTSAKVSIYFKYLWHIQQGHLTHVSKCAVLLVQDDVQTPSFEWWNPSQSPVKNPSTLH